MINFKKIDQWLDRYLEAPKHDPRFFIYKKISWIWTVSVSFAIVGMTILALALKVWTLVWYGLVLLLYYLLVIPIMSMVKNHERVQFFFLLTIVLTTFVTILFLGGITHSMGLVFVGLTCAMSSVLVGKIRTTLIVFIVYGLTIMAAGLMQPWLQVPPENTPAMNLLFHVINILWMTGSTLAFILFYINQRSHFEQELNKNLRELNETKTRLYTHITHEFRTPLTIILGLAEQLKSSPRSRLNQGLEMINRNGRRLLNMINQMLDLQKIQAGALPVQNSTNDIIAFLAYLTHSFSALATAKQIQLGFETNIESLRMTYDVDKMEKIIFNLLSNAIKFTPTGGKIQVTADLQLPADKNLSKQLIIQVKDSGIGIPESEQDLIFDRFYQVREATINSAGGTGIGLSLTKELVKLIGGEISLSSKLGKGTTFSIAIPVKDYELSNSSTKVETDTSYSSLNSELYPPISRSPQKHESAKRPLVLIVEDNQDMLTYLSICLQNDYQLEMAHDGKEGLEKAFQLIPDIIISDVMMPRMDGFEMCTILKNDVKTSHIPIIILTAKEDQPSRLEGLEIGAEAYLTKPFDKNELDIRLRKLIELRNKLRERYTNLDTLSPSNEKSIQREDKFIKNVHEIILDKLSDEAFGVQQLCEQIGMSRAQLYRKFEALTNTSVGKHIRYTRLQKARELLLKRHHNVTEVAMKTGFRNLSHFSAAFKEEFGLSPSQLRSGEISKNQ